MLILCDKRLITHLSKDLIWTGDIFYRSWNHVFMIHGHKRNICSTVSSNWPKELQVGDRIIILLNKHALHKVPDATCLIKYNFFFGGGGGLLILQSPDSCLGGYNERNWLNLGIWWLKDLAANFNLCKQNNDHPSHFIKWDNSYKDQALMKIAIIFEALELVINCWIGAKFHVLVQDQLESSH